MYGVLRMEGEIERMRAANLRLPNESIQLQTQLKQQTGGQAEAPVPQTQAPPTPSQTQPTLGRWGVYLSCTIAEAGTASSALKADDAWRKSLPCSRMPRLPSPFN